MNSVGNAIADVLADAFTEGEAKTGETAQLPKGYNAKRFMLKDTRDEGDWMSGPIRRRLRKLRQRLVLDKWHGDSQSKVKSQIENLPRLVKTHAKRQSDMGTTGKLENWKH